MTSANNFSPIECRGTAYEIGRQYGAAATENIHKSLELLIHGLQQGPFQARADTATILAAAGKYLKNVRAFDPAGLERAKGLADGAGITFEEAFALNCYVELVINYPHLAGLCTSFAVTGPATKDGLTLLGQNIDWHPETPLDLLHIRHTDGLEVLSLAFFGVPYLHLTSTGLGNCTNLTLSPMGPVTKHIPVAFLIYAAMQKPSFDQAFEVLEQSARGLIYHHLADAGGNIAGLESVYDGCTVLKPRRGVLVHANHYETGDYAGEDGARTYIADSFQRAPRLRRLIDQHYGDLTPEIMMTLMADHEGHPTSICRHIDPAQPPELASRSTASLIMVPAERKIYLSSGPPCESEYQTYTLSS
ncbi:MAG: C45 family autoproteolytic acyltransferase/hydrolase [Syntrophales bacterium]|nr:C45 family autoproteolytic acyltransferase/hydrolase [Syntrophales bacterium]